MSKFMVLLLVAGLTYLGSADASLAKKIAGQYSAYGPVGEGLPNEHLAVTIHEDGTLLANFYFLNLLPFDGVTFDGGLATGIWEPLGQDKDHYFIKGFYREYLQDPNSAIIPG